MNKRTLTIGLVVLAVLGLAGAFGLYTVWMGRPEPRGFQHPLENVPRDQRELVVQQCEAIALSEPVLLKAVTDNGLVAEYQVANEGEALEELRGRAYVELTADKNSMVFMVRGTKKEKAVSQAAALTIYQETMEKLIPKEQRDPIDGLN